MVNKNYVPFKLSAWDQSTIPLVNQCHSSMLSPCAQRRLTHAIKVNVKQGPINDESNRSMQCGQCRNWYHDCCYTNLHQHLTNPQFQQNYLVLHSESSMALSTVQKVCELVYRSASSRRNNHDTNCCIGRIVSCL